MTFNCIKHVKCALFLPSSNRLAERAVKTFKSGLKKMRKEDINTKVTRFLFRYRCSPNSVNGVTPDQRSYWWVENFNLIWPCYIQTLGLKLNKKQIEQQKYPDRHVKPREFKTGDNVLVANFSGKGNKWVPGVILEVTGLFTLSVAFYSLFLCVFRVFTMLHMPAIMLGAESGCIIGDSILWRDTFAHRHYRYWCVCQSVFF